MIEEFTINNKLVKVFLPNSNISKLPLIVLNTFEKEGDSVLDKCHNKNFILVEITNIDWNNDLSPWYFPKLYKNDEDYLGNADNFLHEIIFEIMPKVKKYLESKNLSPSSYGIVGYSLAGLFSLYCAYKTNIFSYIGCISGSLWYPDIIEFVKNNKIQDNIKKIYFSLGNRESLTKNNILSKVEENTKEIEKYIKSIGINTIYETNHGNHFKDVDIRTAKGIDWLLK